MRPLTFLEYAMFVVGGIGIFASEYFRLPGGTQLSIVLIGAGLALAGCEALYSREMSLLFSSDSAPGHAGIPAIAWGLMLLSAGAAIIGYGYLNDIGKWPRVLAVLGHSPGWLYLAGGLYSIGFSILLYADSGAARNWTRTLLLRVPRVMLAAILLFAGIAAVAGGSWQLLDPPGFAAFRQAGLSRLDKTLEGSPTQSWIRR